MRQPLRIAAATLQIAGGVLAVLACGLVVSAWQHPNGSDLDAARGTLVGIVLVLGIGLLIIWSRARSRRRWLVTLIIVTAALAAAMLLVTILVARPARFDLHRGLWSTAWMAALDTLLWLIIVAACVVEVRLLPAERETWDRPRWQPAAAVVAPLALLTAVVIMLVSAVPGWMVRANSELTAGAAAGPQQPSTLSGETRWQVDLRTEESALPTRSGLAVPVAADQRHNAGVVMLDPTDGTVRWRFAIRGLSAAPELESTESGRSVVVSFDGRDAAEDVFDQTFTLAADTGRFRALWRTGGAELRGTDPPVGFDHVAQGTNSAIGYSASTGRKLWRYRPERCADPRDVTSTPSVVLVYAYRCDDKGADLIGLDPRTGDRLWAQRVESSSQPGQVLVGPGYQLERDSAKLLRRNLRTGAITWSASAGQDCSGRGALVQAAGTAFTSNCPTGDSSGLPTTVTAYDPASGKELWQHPDNPALTSIVAVDDQRVLGLLSTKRTCTAAVLDRSTTTRLRTFSEDYRGSGYSSPFKPGMVRCTNSEVLRVGDSYVLALQLVRDPDSSSVDDSPQVRFIGLS